MAMSPKLKNKLSASVVGLILAGASAPVILDQFLNEKEGNSLTAYRDGGGLWTICDAPRDKCAHFREINGIAAAFHYLQKNYNPTVSFFL